MPPASEVKHGLLRMAELLAALSFATDLGEGQPMGHVLRTCYLSLHIAQVIRLGIEQLYTALLIHSGCTPASPTLTAVSTDNDFVFRRDLSLRGSRDLLALLGALSDVTKVDFAKPRGPLLFIAGGNDHIIPPALNKANFDKYRGMSGVTDFKEFAGRMHCIIGQKGWEEVADYTLVWLTEKDV